MIDELVFFTAHEDDYPNKLTNSTLCTLQQRRQSKQAFKT